jgi:hypothetical protein
MHADRTPRGQPAFASSQREKTLELLRAAGPRGVSREELIFRYRWTQRGTRIFELERQGYKIRHESQPGQRVVFYVLESEPLELRPLLECEDSCERQHGPRQSHRYAVPQRTSCLPLFAGVRE